jgi:hypothetical protein
MRDWGELIEEPGRVAELSHSEAAAFLVKLTVLQAALASRLQDVPQVQSVHRTDDRLLTAREVADRFARSIDWVYRHARDLPFTVRVTPKTLRFSEEGLRRYTGEGARGKSGRARCDP